MAVQGDAARMIEPAIYWSASPGVTQAAKRYRKNSHAKRAIEKGFTSQLTTKVTVRPFGRLPTLRTEAKSTFIIIGMIISQINTAMEKLMWLPSPNSSPLKV